MKIVVITSSAHVNGASDYLASRFVKGARTAGHEIYRYNAVDHQNNFVMVDEKNTAITQHDDIEQLLQKIVRADLLVMVTPLYYFGMSSMLKTIVDRFYDHNHELKGGKRVMMFATAAGNDFSSLQANYRQIVEYMHWQDAGTIWDGGALTHPAIDKYGRQAYELGKGLTAAN